jgi:hypothetical protein
MSYRPEYVSAVAAVPQIADDLLRRATRQGRAKHEVAALQPSARGRERQTSRDFVPWRFLDAGRLSATRISSLPASKNLHSSGRLTRGRVGRPAEHRVGA